MMDYHISEGFYSAPDHNLMGIHIEEAVYAPLYYSYGGKNSAAPLRSPEGQRTTHARHVEEKILERAPEAVLVLMEASAGVIKQRMRANVHPDPEAVVGQKKSKPFGEPTRGVVQEGDVEFVLKRFEEEFEASLLKNKMALDTTSATVKATLAEFVDKVQPFLSDADRRRMMERRSA